MARYTGPKSKIARRFGEPILGPSKALARKNYGPGQHGKGKRGKVSEYALQLKEKQKVKYTYGILENHIEDTPVAFQQMLPHMKMHDWLYNYRYEWAIQKSFAGMTNRAKYITESDTAFKVFVNNITFMQPYYDEFFPLLKAHADFTLQELLNAG